LSRPAFLLGLMAALWLMGISVAWADTPINTFFVQPSSTQAGGHPNIETLIVDENEQLREQLHFEESECGCRDPKAIEIHLPPGVIGVPGDVPKCSDSEFGSIKCSPDSQVGILKVGLGGESLEEDPLLLGRIPVYNLIPHPSEAALLGASLPGIDAPIYFVFTPRTGSDYGLDERTLNIAHPLFGLHFSDLEIWGVPADPSHQEERAPIGCNPSEFNLGQPGERCHPGVPSNAPLAPFTINPTTCGVTDLTATVELLDYERDWTQAMTPYPATTGCDQLSFNPSLFAQPTTTATDSASGIDIDIKVPQDLSADSPSASQIRDSTVTLPKGFSINANAGDGKEACSDAQARFGTEEMAQCPENAKIGTVQVSTPTLPGPLPGYVYLGEPKPGERYRLIVAADGFNVHVKLPGTVNPDPQTGQLTVTFKDLPQFPFSEFNMHLFGAERGSLATPAECGTFPVNSTFTPWDSLLPQQTSVQYFTVTQGPDGKACPGSTLPFNPTLEAGVTDKTAGKHSPFVLKVTREDGDQVLSQLKVKTPPGFSAALKGVPYCPESAISHLGDSSYSGLAEQSDPACPVASQIGTVVASAGAGTRPINVDGKVYLAGPYKGAPISFEAVIPAVSGPYDLGNVAVRTAVYVNPATAQVSAVSDPFPQIIGGIPLRTRLVQLKLDRNDFALNPTNCDPFSVDATIVGDQGAQADLSRHFQVADCSNLAYGPKLRLSLSGGVRRRGHPAIHAVLTTGPGEANSQKVAVTMPKGELLDQGHIGHVCTRVQFAEDACPSSSELGSAEATSPLLDQPLKGTVYLRANPAHRLPDIAVALKGQIDIELDGRVDSLPQRLRTTFEGIPDAPVSRFVLNLKGGKQGLLQNGHSLCGRHPEMATSQMTGQNGDITSGQVSLNPQCGKSGHKRHSRARRAG
jgi:hypothetical protein